MQSVSATQTVAQASTLQTNGSHARTTGGVHPPAPSQNVARVSVPAAHEATPHMTDCGALAQVWFAAHAPVLPHSSLTGQRLCGSALPVPTNVHVPRVPFRLHAWQSGQVAALVLQQTPSTHRPAPHWLSAPHASPTAPALMQWPPAAQ
jgi:hypothetical protein